MLLPVPRLRSYQLINDFFRFFRFLDRNCYIRSVIIPFLRASLCLFLICRSGCLTLVLFLWDSPMRTLCVLPVIWHSYPFFLLLGVYVLTRSRVRRNWFRFIKSSYLCCRCSVTCFNFDKLQEVRPLVIRGFKMRLYTRN